MLGQTEFFANNPMGSSEYICLHQLAKTSTQAPFGLLYEISVGSIASWRQQE